MLPISTVVRDRAVVSGPAGQAMAGPVLGLTKQFIGLEVVISTIKLYCSLCFKSVGSLPRIAFHALSYTISHAISLSSFNRGIRSFKASVLLIVGFCLQ